MPKVRRRNPALSRDLRKRPTRATPMAKKKSRSMRQTLYGGLAPTNRTTTTRRPSNRPVSNPLAFPANPGSLIIASAQRIQRAVRDRK